MEKRAKKYIFKDGYFCIMYGMSAEELAIEEMEHGCLISIEMAE